MRTLVSAALLFVLTGCGPKGKTDPKPDPEFWFVYSVTGPCGGSISLSPPYSVSRDGWFGPAIRAPRELLDNPATKTLANSGVGATNRISFNFQQILPRSVWNNVLVQGLREGTIKPAPSGHQLHSSSVATFASYMDPDGHIVVREYWYSGDVREHSFVMMCSPPEGEGGSVPNPSCQASVLFPRNYVLDLTLPIDLTARLPDIEQLGERVFKDQIERCRVHPAESLETPARRRPLPPT